MEPALLRRIPPGTCCTSDQPLWFKTHSQNVTFNQSSKFFSHSRSSSSHERPTSFKWSKEVLPVRHKGAMDSYVWKGSLGWFIDLLCIHLGNLQQTTYLLINLEVWVMKQHEEKKNEHVDCGPWSSVRLSEVSISTLKDEDKTMLYTFSFCQMYHYSWL